MERETKKFKTKNGFEIEIKTYLTYGESQKLQAVFLKNMEMDTMDLEKKSGKVNGNVIIEAQKKAIEIIVVSINGEKENILDKFMDLPKEDGDEAYAEIDKISQPISEEKKTK